MAERLTDRAVKALPAPAKGNRIYFDGEVGGFAARVTAAGARSFVLDYRSGGCRRRFTIGNFPDWTTSAARDEAKALKRRIDRGEDPMAARQEERAAPTMGDLIDRFKAEHLPKRRPSTIRDYTGILDKLVLPELGRMKVADVSADDVEKLHGKISKKTPFRANRMAAVLSKMMTFAVKAKMRTDNPVRGLERNPEDRRERFLSAQELAALAAALAEHSDQRSADAIRLLVLTGARRGETLSATWEQFDLEAGVWTKPSAATKQRKSHRIPLSPPAREHLVSIRQRQDVGERFVFPGDVPGRPVTDVKKSWAALTARATVLLWASQPETPAGKLVARLRESKPEGALPSLAECRAVAKDLPAGLTDARLHDLRHSFASVLVSGGASLPLIGAMLGHTQVSTTARYAHLADDPLRAAAERVGEVWKAAETAKLGEVVRMPRKR